MSRVLAVIKMEANLPVVHSLPGMHTLYCTAGSLLAEHDPREHP